MSETFAYENLLAGSQQPIVSNPETVLLGQNLTRGALLGRVARALGDALPDPGNAGEGGISGVAMTAESQVGIYEIECIDKGPAAVFAVRDPTGRDIGSATAEVAYQSEIAFLISAYGAAFDVGDKFTVEIEAGSGYVRQADRDAVDGSELPYAVLAEDVDASLAAALTSVYLKGEFNEAEVGYAAGEDADDWRDLCAAVGIYLRATVAA